ncbi:hypothetical protein F4Y19_20210 [Candidatus Poribacteria bacterium]|nr:hypothetical protein [Candidatus Poribacteria bacterium]
MKRLKEISEQIREGITEFMEAVDGTESLLDKTILDMKKRLAEAKDLVATAMAEEQRLKRAYQEAIDTAEIWGKEVDTASQMDDPGRASKARERERQHLLLADDYKRQIDVQETVVARLKAALHEFYHEFRDTVKRSETLCQRQKQAETRVEFYKKVYQLLVNELDTHVSKVFEQAEQKLKATEAEAEIWEDKGRAATAATETDGDNFNLDQALAELKDDVLGSGRK